jgi:catechol 2,3-dioxygenase-like lactoylglutathione lyase family enzyme
MGTDPTQSVDRNSIRGPFARSIMIKGIDHFAISTGNIDRLSAFYREQLGFTDVSAHEWREGNTKADQITGLRDSDARVILLRLGNVCLELFEFHHPTPTASDPGRPACDHGITHLCLQVEDIHTEYDRLRAHGMQFHCPPQEVSHGRMRATYGRDPDGNIIELLEYMAAESTAVLRPLPSLR